MPGPVPKHPSQRRNPNPLWSGEWRELHVRRLEKAIVPPLPPRSSEFSKDDRRRWEIWRHDPVSAFWTSADVELAKETLALYANLTSMLLRSGSGWIRWR